MLLKACDRARNIGLVQPDETVELVANADIDSYRSPTGVRVDGPRPAWAVVGITEHRFFVLAKESRYNALCFLQLITTGQYHPPASIDLQFVMTTHQVASIRLTNVDDADNVWGLLKSKRDAAWMNISRRRQVELMWFAAEGAGAFWRNPPGRTWEDEQIRTKAFVEGHAEAGVDPYRVSFVSSPVDLDPSTLPIWPT